MTTSIEWTRPIYNGILYTGDTLNPADGCDPVSSGCDHCYAMRIAERFRGTPGHVFEHGFDLRLWPQRINRPLRTRKPTCYFVNSMSDWCHEDIPLEYTLAVFRMMCRADWHLFQLLTKRAPTMVKLLPALQQVFLEETGSEQWPAHIWVGVTVETPGQQGRLKHLRAIGAPVTFVSYEPALASPQGLDLSDISWCIGGAESGPGARPMDLDWMRALRDICQRDAVAFFFKQQVAGGKKIPTPELDGRQWVDYPAIDLPQHAYRLLPLVPLPVTTTPSEGTIQPALFEI